MSRKTNELKAQENEFIESESTEEEICEEWNPEHNSDYFDLDEIDEYGEDDENRESNYLLNDIWDIGEIEWE